MSLLLWWPCTACFGLASDVVTSQTDSQADKKWVLTIFKNTGLMFDTLRLFKTHFHLIFVWFSTTTF